ncbi:MAG: DUF445 family protein [Clostridiales bacterium]|nr:DUF445 family protein [Clostridiales bacterium]
MMMYWKWIAIPLVGAVIGYATNWIAVKMLFRPHEEKRLFGRRLPFTPGVIPRGQGRLARAIGRAVEEQLLTEDVLEKELLSDDKKEQIRAFVAGWLEKGKTSEEILRDAAVSLLPEEAVEDFIQSAEEKVTEVIFEKLVEVNLGKTVSEKVLEVAKEKLAESMFGMMFVGSLLDAIAQQVEEKINEYIEGHGKPLIEQAVWDESEKLQGKTVGSVFEEIDEYEFDLPGIVIEQYEKVVVEQTPRILKSLHLSVIVEDRINAMDMAELEGLILSIMKKELGVVVNLGALIGFILGLVNLLIICI